MAYALVSLGSAVQSVSGSAVSGLAFGQATVAGHLLICWWEGDGSATVASTPSGWTAAISGGATGTSCAAQIFYKIAAGSDAVPSFGAISSSQQAVQLAEFSGNPASSPLDQTGTASSTTSTDTATAGATDAASNELLITTAGVFYSRATTDSTGSVTSNNATITAAGNNAGASSVSH